MDDAAVVQRPRWAVRELISWIAVGLLVVGVGALVGGVFRTVDRVAGHGGVVEVAAPHGGDVHIGVDGRPLPPGTFLLLDNAAVAQLHVLDLPIELRVLIGSGEALAGLGFFVAAMYGRRLLLSIWDGRPFDPRNPRRLVAISIGLVVGGVGSSVIATLAGAAVLGHLGIDATGGQPLDVRPWWLDLSGLWWALIALALAEAFRRGRRLTEDADGLV